jgi:uncharacterized Zn finger protein
MENLAKLSGDVEQQVAVFAKDLSDSLQYLKIAELYLTHKIQNKAIEWAEKGLNAFSERPDERLREFLAKAYHHLKRHDEAMKLIWANFFDYPSLDKFKLLKHHSELIQQWPDWRRKAIEHIHLGIQKAKTARPRSPYAFDYSWESNSNNSTLVEIYLWEGDIEAAWKQAQSEGANLQLWHRLAEKREKTHPADAATAYQKIVEDEIKRGDNESYRQAVNHIGKIQTLMKTANLEGESIVYIKEVRANFKAKRNFIKLFDAKFGNL